MSNQITRGQILDLLIKYDINQKQLAKLINVREETISRWMKGKTKPDLRYNIDQWKQLIEQRR